MYPGLSFQHQIYIAFEPKQFDVIYHARMILGDANFYEAWSWLVVNKR